MRRTIFIALGLIVGILALGWLLFGFFGIQALWTDRVINEDVPLAHVTDPQTIPESLEKIVANPKPAVEPAAAPEPKPVQKLVPIEPRLLARGIFNQGDSTYTIQGKATITEQGGKRTLSLTDFSVTNGPDLFVYLVSASGSENNAVRDAVDAESFVSLGALKGNKGNQNYVVPPEVQLNENSVVSIWCRRFFRNFGAADLGLLPLK